MFLLGRTFCEICKNVNRASNDSLNDTDLTDPPTAAAAATLPNRVLAGFSAQDV